MLDVNVEMASPVSVVVEKTDSPPVTVQLPPAVSVVTVEVPGPQGERGEPGQDAPAGGSDAHHVHEQPVADMEWEIHHGLGKHPSITVVDSAGTVVTGRYSYPDPANVCVLRFSAPFSGRAYLN